MELSNIKSINEYFSSDDYYTVGMTAVQMDNFIFDHQLTPVRKARQLILELEARFGSLKEHQILNKREAIEMETLVSELEILKSGGEDIRLKLLDIEELEIKRNLTERRIRGDQYAIDSIMKTTNEFEKSIGKKISEIDLEDDVDEKEYWIKRMANQAGIDLATIGQISTGNMTSLMQLPEEDISRAFSSAIALAHSVKSEVSRIDIGVLENIDEKAMLSIRNDLMGKSLTNNLLKETI